MKNVLVIGMGRFGRHLAKKMLELGNDVMIVDTDEAVIEELAPVFTDSYIGDCTNEGTVRSLDVSNFDICFVSIGENFQSSLEITALLKDMGAKYVVSKANRDIQARFLKSVGADEVIYPERAMAERLAMKFNSDDIYDYIELTDDFSIYEISVPKDWVGKSVVSLNVRRNYNLNIIAVKKDGLLRPMPGGDYVFREDEHMVVIGKADSVIKISANAKDKRKKKK